VKKYHVISAKKMGWDTGYDYIFFPVDEFSPDSAMAQFQKVTKETLKNNHWVPYTAFEYDGETYYSIQYSGIADEDEINK
jgi:hypothetical protein